MEIAVQQIRTQWAKESRGAPDATRSNAVPVGFVLPVLCFPLYHEMIARESDDFIPSDSWDLVAPPEGVDLVEKVGQLRVHLEVTPWGMPRRWRHPPAVRLPPGERLRWHVNYRFTNTSDGSWWYSLETLNVASAPTSTEVFLGNPTRFVDERASLR